MVRRRHRRTDGLARFLRGGELKLTDRQSGNCFSQLASIGFREGALCYRRRLRHPFIFIYLFILGISLARVRNSAARASFLLDLDEIESGARTLYVILVADYRGCTARGLVRQNMEKIGTHARARARVKLCIAQLSHRVLRENSISERWIANGRNRAIF